MLDSILNTLLFRRFRAEILKNKFIQMIESEGIEEFLEVLLKLMRLVFCIDKDFRRNIENFNARYLFKDKNGDVTVSAVFNNGKLKVSKDTINDTNVTIIFKDQCALFNFIISQKPDVINAMLNQDVTFKGNVNYITKFVYMATHLKLEIMGAQ